MVRNLPTSLPFASITPLKTNISPENWWLEDDSFPFKMVPFLGSTFRSFPGGVDSGKSSRGEGWDLRQVFFRHPWDEYVYLPTNFGGFLMVNVDKCAIIPWIIMDPSWDWICFMKL